MGNKGATMSGWNNYTNGWGGVTQYIGRLMRRPGFKYFAPVAKKHYHHKGGHGYSASTEYSNPQRIVGFLGASFPRV